MRNIFSFSVPIIALAVGEGRKENLRYITLGDNRIIRVASFDKLDDGNVVSRLKTLLKNPEDSKETFFPIP